MDKIVYATPEVFVDDDKLWPGVQVQFASGLIQKWRTFDEEHATVFHQVVADRYNDADAVYFESGDFENYFEHLRKQFNMKMIDEG